MKDARLSAALHVLLHLDGAGTRSSAWLGARMDLHPVVVRRTLAGLREAGIVRAEKGHGGGWSLARPLATVTLADVYSALGAPPLFVVGHRSEAPSCVLERAVNETLDDALAKATSVLLSHLGGVTVADLCARARAKRPNRTCSTMEDVDA